MRIIIMFLSILTAVSIYLTAYVINTVRKVDLSKWAKIIMTAMSIATTSISGISTWNATAVSEAERIAISIPSSGLTLAGSIAFNVYYDVTGTRVVKEISWGELKPGQTGNFTAYLKNEGNMPLYAEITWNETSWKPANASQFFSISWNFGSNPLSPNRARKIMIQLHVGSNIHDITEFSFDVVIISQDEPFAE